MNLGNTINRHLYRLFLGAAKGAKQRYYLKKMKAFNRGFVDLLTEGWEEKSRKEAYQRVVVPRWKEYGRRPERFWFELAGSRDHVMDPRFIPSDMYYTELLPYLNNLQFRFALEDKNFLEMFFHDVKQAKTVCRRIAGEYYDANGTLIHEQDAVGLCRNQQAELFIKPSLYGGCGLGIQSFTSRSCSDKKIREYFLDTGENFIVQERIRQHPVLEKISPDSVCTIRVLSLFLNGEVTIPNIFLRYGVAGAGRVMVRNEYDVEILPDGRLASRVYLDEGGWFGRLEAGIKEDDLVIPGMDRIRTLTEALHPRVGHFKWIGWDFTLDEAGDPLLIEFNSTPGEHAQRVCGRPLFGDMTDKVLEDYFRNRSLEGVQLRGCWCTNDNIDRYRE